VTIIHRLNGLKMFRLLLRSEDQVQAIAGLDDAFKFMEDVHTNVIAGLALDDGQTIVAWLPEAEVELGPPVIPFPAPRAPRSPKALPAPPRADMSADGRLAAMDKTLFESPDLTVIGSDGRRLAARYVGLDGATGLSVLKLTDRNPSTMVVAKDSGIAVGQSIRLFGPEPVARTRAAANGNLYVRMGETPGTVFTVARAPSGGVSRFKARSARLLPENVGGVVVNDAGETVGIVDGIVGTEASILPAAMIRMAAKRVLTQQASVPKPWLGVIGEPVASLKVEQMLNRGWQADRATTLAEDHCGIFLTWIAPGSPAALASLRAGDVILKVNDGEIQTADDFSWWLEQAGPSSSVRFIVARPDSTTPEAINVKLSESLDPAVALRLLKRRPPLAQGMALMDQGIETIAVQPAVASRLGATSGLLIIYVEPATAAFKAGLRPGDVIEAIDGRQISSLTRPLFLPNTPGAAYTFDVVRDKQKLVVTVVTSDKQ
jgi:S1-C subfamily serine protease